MCRTVEEYLDRLAEAMRGSDPALIQDAAADAEEFLRSTLEADEAAPAEAAGYDSLTAAIARYGTPEETAAAYRELESRFPPGPARRETGTGRSGAAAFFGVFKDPRAWSAVLFMLISVTSLVTGLWAVVGAALSIFTPVTLIFLLSLRGLALLEGRKVEVLLGVRMPRRPKFERHRTWWSRIRGLLTDPSLWKTLAYLVLMLPLGPAYALLVLFPAAAALKALLYPVLGPVFGRPLITLANGPVTVPDWIVPLVSLGGLLILTAILHLARGIGRLHGRLARSLLVKKPPEEPGV